MADITNQVVVSFSDAYLRPITEAARNLKIRLDDAKVEYQTNIASLLAGHVDDDKLMDGSPDDGRTQVTKKDIADLLTMLNGVITEIGTAGNDALLAKFTVRPPMHI